MSTLTSAELGGIVARVEPELKRFAELYDEGKYPPGELVRLRQAFARPEAVTEADVEAAVVWKYGHTGKTNYPRQQRAVAAKIATFWPGSPIQRGQPPREAFDTWRSHLGPTSFITVCFLLHLTNPADLPILDQHNFRSVNHHLASVRPGVAAKAKPSRFEDLLMVRDFGVAVTRDWNRHSTSAPPSADTLDRYLMMHGKSLKARKRR